MEMPNGKIHLKDIVESIQCRDTPIFIVGDKKWWGDRITKDQIATHADCEYCGNEFKKDYTYQKLCFNCNSIQKSQRYAAMKFKEWDGKTPLVIFDSDQYFFDESDIEDYVANYNDDLDFEDANQNTPLEASDLKLVICQPNYMSEISADYWEDAMPAEGDGELPVEIEAALNSFNELIKKQSALSWKPGKYRTTIDLS